LEKKPLGGGLKVCSGLWVLRNPTKSVTFPKPPRGNAEVSGRKNRPRHSRRYGLPAHRALGAQHRRSPSYGRAKIRSYVKSAFSASPATADDLTHKPPAFPPESGRPRHILHWNRRSAPSRSAAPLTKPGTSKSSATSSKPLETFGCRRTKLATGLRSANAVQETQPVAGTAHRRFELGAKHPRMATTAHSPLGLRSCGTRAWRRICASRVGVDAKQKERTNRHEGRGKGGSQVVA
jgi:hypothetical protein